MREGHYLLWGKNAITFGHDTVTIEWMVMVGLIEWASDAGGIANQYMVFYKLTKDGQKRYDLEEL